jgi:hypothetical protein
MRDADSAGSFNVPEPNALYNLLGDTSEVASEKRKFLKNYSDCYGYDGRLESIRNDEFRRLAGQAYLDYAGAALYSERQVQACSEELLNNLLCNPHRCG